MRESERLKLKSLLDTGKTNEEILEAMKPRRGNGNGREIPEGGISLRQAERKYDISINTMRGWIDKGWLTKLPCESKREVYIDESIISKIAKKYKNHKGRGNRAIMQIMRVCTNN